MTREEKLDRFEELDAGRVLGDLDANECAEWEDLSAELGRGGDSGLDLFAAELEASLSRGSVQKLPSALARKLLMAPAAKAEPKRSNFAILPWVGWALAACLLALLVLRNDAPEKIPATAERREALLREAKDLSRLPFSGTTGEHAKVTGEVVWSDSRQEGYMTLAGVPANDPSRQQYQLWIVDPARDALPVDGGVFDLPASSGPVVVPIDAKLLVHGPAAFVITREQPGGVVKSAQEVVVAIAKR